MSRAASILLLGVAVVLMWSAAAEGKTMSMAPPVEAPGPSAGATQDCMTALFGLSDCLSYVTKGSNTTKPDKPCCPELAGLVQNNPICLCQLLATGKGGGLGSSLGIDIDVNRALKLPSVCKVTTPPISMCSLVGVPVGIPTAAPAGSPGASPPATAGGEPSATPTGAAVNLMLPCLLGTAISSLLLPLLLLPF